MSRAGGHRQPNQETEVLRRRAIETAQSGQYDSVRELAEDIGWTYEALRQSKVRFAWFRDAFNEAWHKNHGDVDGYDGTFLSFRKVFLGMTTTKFQAKIVKAIENARPGEVTLILIPPAHGKTTLLEDYCTWKLVEDPSFKITVASETVDHGMKVLGRVRDRFEPEGPTPLIPQRFGPIAPVEGENKTGQVWGAKRFNVYKKLSISGERDYSMSCVGIVGRVQGTRCDLLLLDDMQDVKSLELSHKYYNIVTQSFLSRPEMFGRTVIIGTRVGALDVYSMLIKHQVPDRTIAIPAYDVETSRYWPCPTRKPILEDETTWAPKGVYFLWPEKYDDATGFPPRIDDDGNSVRIDDLHRFRYAKLRFTLGEKTWWRIYMQRPEEGDNFTFDRQTTEKTFDFKRSITSEPARIPATERSDSRSVPVVIGLDPSLGGNNGVIAAAAYPDRLDVLHCKLDADLTKYSQIIGHVEQECEAWSTANSHIEAVIVENQAFQKGLLTDERMEEVQRHFGFRLLPHTSAKEKVDSDIGIRGMPLAMMRQEITLPYADDLSRENMMLLLEQLHQWQAGSPGGGGRYRNGKAPIDQDLVMCLWFVWRYWKATVKEAATWAPAENAHEFRGTASPLRRHRRTRPIAQRRRPYGVR